MNETPHTAYIALACVTFDKTKCNKQTQSDNSIDNEKTLHHNREHIYQQGPQHMTGIDDTKLVQGTTATNLREKQRIAERFAQRAYDKAINMGKSNNLIVDPTCNLQQELEQLFCRAMLDPIQMHTFYSNDDE